MLDRLEQRGLIRRDSDADDRRSFVVSLTKEGRPVAAQVRNALLAVERTALAGLNAAERALVVDALDAIAAAATASVQAR